MRTSAARDATTGPREIELHLRDGGHVLLSIEKDAMDLGEPGDELIDAILAAWGSERDVEREIQAWATRVGLECTTSSGQHPTVIVIRCRPARTPA